MPTIEVEDVELDSKEPQSYELAFHVLPTIVEGEVETVFEKIKGLIKQEGGEVFDEEAPERFELAYEVLKHLEGKNRRFKSAYFGWVRFKATPSSTVRINAEIDHNPLILRHLLIKLTKLEEENPFRFHDAIRNQKMVINVGEGEIAPDFSSANEDVEDGVAVEEDIAVDEVALDKALEDKAV